MISSVDGEQTPLEIVQRKVLIPTASPETLELGELLFEIVAGPLITDHSPVPIDGVFP